MKTLLLFLLVSLLLLFCFPACVVRQLIYPGQHLQSDASDFPAHYRNFAVEYTTSDGLRLRGWLLNRGTAAPLVAVYGGNNMDVGDFVDLALRDKSRSYLLMNYRGYGESEGSPSQRLLVDDACDLLAWARVRVGGEPPVYLMGFSIGSGVAMQVAARLCPRGELDGVVLLCPFDSLKETARLHVGGLLSSLIREDVYDSAAVASQLDVPVTILAGRRDRIVLPEQTRRLISAFKRRLPRVHWLPAGHNDLLLDAEAWGFILQGLSRSKADGEGK